MEINEWEIWHSYLTFSLEKINDLNAIAKNLVKNDLCKAVYDSNDNGIIWKEDNEIKLGNIKLFNKGYEPTAKAEFPEGLPNCDFAFECAIQAIQMRFGELRVFNNYLDSFSYIRGYIGACYMKFGDYIIGLYPQLKIFDNGVIILIFRIFSRKDELDSDLFIEKQLNLFQHLADDIKIPPELLKLYVRSSIQDDLSDPINLSKLLKITKSKSVLNSLDSVIEENQKESIEIDFKFNIISLSEFDTFDELNLNTFIDIVLESTLYVFNQNKSEIKFVLKGKNALQYTRWSHWIGQPSVYILKFKNQPEDSKEIEEKYANELSHMMLRVPISNHVESENSSLRNLRRFKDYLFYMNEAIMLWVSSNKDFAHINTNEDPNRGRAIYEKQVQAESINYIHMSYKRQAERAYLRNISYQSVLEEMRDLLKLENAIKKVSSFGEIDSAHTYAIRQLNLPEMRNNTEKFLRLRAECINDDRMRNTKYFGWIISILFGLAGSSSLANNVILPFWRYIQWKLPLNSELQIIFSYIFAICIMAIPIIISWKFLKEHK